MATQPFFMSISTCRLEAAPEAATNLTRLIIDKYLKNMHRYKITP
jgi:hypothetical protein